MRNVETDEICIVTHTSRAENAAETKRSQWHRFELPNYYRTCVYFSVYEVAMQKNAWSLGYLTHTKISSGTFFRHEGEGRMNWWTRSTKYSPTCPLVLTSVMTFNERFWRPGGTKIRIGEWVPNAPLEMVCSPGNLSSNDNELWPTYANEDPQPSCSKEYSNLQGRCQWIQRNRLFSHLHHGKITTSTM